jgi:galactokinase
MWQLTSSAPPDVMRCVAALQQSDFFLPELPIVLARAPGRLDLMGGIADYSGSLVLELPLAMAAVTAVQITDEPYITVHSTLEAADVRIANHELLPAGHPIEYQQAQQRFAADPATHWASYLLGVLLTLAIEEGCALPGMRIYLASDVPAGKGVSSSAAIEVATMRAAAAALGITIDGRTLAIMCQKVENLIVGAPCGIMDQMTSACGEADTLLALRCQPAELEPSVHIPASLRIWGIDSGIRHAVTGADYGSVRVGAFMGYRIMMDQDGAPTTAISAGRVRIHDTHYAGYLANVTPSQWLQQYRDHVPITMSGEAFLRQYHGFSDTITTIDPQQVYAVRMPTEHPIHEHHRVQVFRTLLKTLPLHGLQELDSATCIALGELMYQSHASYSACGLGSAGTDAIVQLVRKAGPQAGVYGAKITGGGSGGTVAILARYDAEAVIHAIAERYQQQTGHAALVIGGSSPGAIASGVFRAEWRI